jgi:integrase
MNSSPKHAVAAFTFTTCGTHLRVSPVLAQNVPARVVMEILGHSQLAMMTDLYFHVMPTAQREAADAVDRVFVQPN